MVISLDVENRPRFDNVFKTLRWSVVHSELVNCRPFREQGVIPVELCQNATALCARP
jgi:hypothetical protein